MELGKWLRLVIYNVAKCMTIGVTDSHLATCMIWHEYDINSEQSLVNSDRSPQLQTNATYQVSMF